MYIGKIQPGSTEGGTITLAGGSFEIRVEGFSGPLDVLCHLLESREIEASSIRVSDIIETYFRFLTQTERLSIYEAAEFLSLCSRILLGKIKALLPGENLENDGGEPDNEADEEALLDVLQRYRPYRAAAELLMTLQERRERHFIRVVEENETAAYELKDLYSFCRQWWSLYASYAGSKGKSKIASGERQEGFLDPVPEEKQVEEKIRELQQRFYKEGEIPLEKLVPKRSDRSLLVVTILALLEMCRLGCVSLSQKEGFGTLWIRSLKHAVIDGPMY